MSRENNPRVNTTVPKDLKKIAILEDIDFAEALRAGIRLLSSLKELTDEEEMEQEIQKLNLSQKEIQIKIKMLLENLTALRKENAEKEAEDKRQTEIKNNRDEVEEEKKAKKKEKIYVSCGACSGAGHTIEEDGAVLQCPRCMGLGRGLS